ncbi:hypothetical protein, partial [Pseudonocardia sp.]|uniref:hypothetical protein n=1 Tax=Pseudonocardia sp. TaxID=60912 RepID=UPI0026140F0B
MAEPSPARHGAVRRAAAIASMGAYRVRLDQSSGRWASPWSGVLVDTERAADPLTLSAAAVELGGPDVLLAGPTAAHLHGCSSAEPTPVHLIAPYGHWLRTRRGLVVHNGHVPDGDRAVRHDLPVLSLERTITDLLCTQRPDRALAVVDEALAMIEPTGRERFRATIGGRLASRRDPRGTRRGAQLLELATGRAESPAESWMLCRIVDSGYPVPEVNWSVVGLDGREVYRVDLAWPALRIAVEYHGYAAHVGRTEEDQARAEDLRRRGWILVEVWAEDLAQPARYERDLDAAFARRGVDTRRRRPRALRGRSHRERRRGARRTASRRAHGEPDTRARRAPRARAES